MKNKSVIYLIITVALIVLLLVLAAIYRSPNDLAAHPIIGTWNYMDGDKVDYGILYTFDETSRGSYAYKGNQVNFTYTVEDGKLFIKYEKDTTANVLNYSIVDNKLTISDSEGNKTIYKRK